MLFVIYYVYFSVCVCACVCVCMRLSVCVFANVFCLFACCIVTPKFASLTLEILSFQTTVRTLTELLQVQSSKIEQQKLLVNQLLIIGLCFFVLRSFSAAQL